LQPSEYLRHNQKQEELGEGSSLVGITIDIPRQDDGDPTPERFQAMLEATLAVVELNESVNQARRL
jgi:hypothetical protein